MQSVENKVIPEENNDTGVTDNASKENKAVKEVMILNDRTFQDRLYIIRGQKVMLDFDLAEIYGYSTKRFNEQVKRNISKFPEDFMIELNANDMDKILKSQFATSSWGGSRYLPHAFTEQGIYMLMAVLKGPLAVEQSKTLIRLFKQMKD